MLCLSPCAPHRHLHHLHHRHPPARPAAAASCGNARGPGVALCLRTPTPATPEERRQRRRVARLHDASAASASAAAPALKPPATVSRPTPAAERRGRLREMRRLWWVCGVGYWVQGFRCFPWLALNFHFARGLGLSPAALQLVQNAGNLPLVAKPLFGVLSDAVYIGRAHRLPYISIGGTLQLIRLFVSSPFCSSSPFSQFSFLEFLRLPRRGCLARNSAIFYANSDAFVRICVNSLEFSVNSMELSAFMS